MSTGERTGTGTGRPLENLQTKTDRPASVPIISQAQVTVGCLLGVDYGTVRIGLAVSDPDRKIAFPFESYTRRSRDQDASHFQKLIKEETIVQIVLGLPVHLSGREGEKATEARTFGKWLQKATGLPVVLWDERFTTVQAEEHLREAGLTNKRRKDRRDKVAAQILLQSYLEAGCPSEQVLGPLEG